MPARWKPIQLIWDKNQEIWDLTEGIWSEEIIKLWQGGSRGGVRKQWDTWKKFDKEKQQRVIKVILQLKGIKFTQTKTIKEYKVTIEDIKLLMEAFEESLKEMNVTVEEIQLMKRNVIIDDVKVE